MTHFKIESIFFLMRFDKIFGLGLFRVLLAISVVIAHSGSIFGHNIINGVIAVQSFYIISGFLMALILTEKYHSYKLFFTNRYLRLYPTYIVVLILTVISSILFYIFLNNGLMLTSYFQYFSIMTLPSILFILLSNLTIFGLDILMFLGLNPQTGTLFFTPNFLSVPVPAYTFILVPQAWTLGIELLFYLIVPFLNKLKTQYLIFFLLFSIVLRLISYFTPYNGLSSDPWIYRFFPYELAFFIAGMLAYRNFLYLKERNYRSVVELLPVKNLKFFSDNLLLLLFLFTFLFNFIPANIYFKMGLFYILVLISLPNLFIQNSEHEIDRNIGDYSYPVYVGHYLIIAIITAFSLKQMLSVTTFGILSIILSIMFASVLVKYIEEPLKKFRQKRAIDKNLPQ